jgi:hypothetical protein
MHTLWSEDGPRVWFVIADVDPACFEALRDLVFVRVADGFGRAYPADSPQLEVAYAGFVRSAEELVLQTAGLRPVPWEAALEGFLLRIDSESLDWWLAGSAALAARGLEVMPRDLDIITDADGARRLGTILEDELVQPVEASSGWIADWFGRAFLHARIEWVGDVDAAVDAPDPSDFGPLAASRLETIVWRGHPLRVPPLDLQLAVSERRGLTARAEQIRRWVRQDS